VVVGDVSRIIRASKARFDAILLDVDNGPDAFTLDSNHRLYTPWGLERLHAALREAGVLGIWSASGDRHFPDTLTRAGFEVEVERVQPRSGRGRREHVLFLGRRRPRSTSRR
jgi:spermidine synthase